jgi:hypothetical protein
MVFQSTAQEKTYSLKASVTVGKSVKANMKSNGRLLLFITENPNVEPRQMTWPSPGFQTYIFAQNIQEFNASKTIMIANGNQWTSNTTTTLNSLPAGEYAIQLLWDQDTEESRVNAPNNLFSTKQVITLDKDANLDFELSEVIEPRLVNEHPLVRYEELKSDLISKFWNKPMSLKATILLPKNYKKGNSYAMRYNVSGFGGRYTRINRLTKDKEFMDWWESDLAPQIITVFLDSDGPLGDHYQMDSENSGPYGEALTKEFIPYLENKYRGAADANMRFVDGCSTGGWVSLGLQLYYPDVFNGCFSYSPDAIEFERYQLLNIYKDKNAYVNEFGYERPVMRSTLGEPMISFRDFVNHENALAASNTYINSGGQIGSHTALYSPKGDDGLPKPLFDAITGDMDVDVAEHWKKYDFLKHTQKNWTTLGPKLQGKVYVWMGDMDHFYLNMATRSFAEYLDTTENPKSDAKIEFSPMKGHCTEFSNKRVYKQIAERVKMLEKN